MAGSTDVGGLVGMTKEAATAKMEGSGFRVRVTSEDGKSFIGTRDFRTDRVNLVVVGGKVVRASVG